MSTQALRVATGAAKPTNFPGMLDAYKGEIARALPKHLNADTICLLYTSDAADDTR